MELEYKWKFPAERRPGELLLEPYVAGCFRKGPEIIKMKAAYYDTEDRLLRFDYKAALRLRSENDETVCCLKIPRGGDGAYREREEYEVKASDVKEGLSMLPGAGAPAELCSRFSGLELVIICGTEFTRHLYSIEISNKSGRCTAEMAFDSGKALKGSLSAGINELELEFTEGSRDAFHLWAEELAARFGLEKQELSKYAQAASL